MKTASDFLTGTTHTRPIERERAVLSMIEAGAVPSFNADRVHIEWQNDGHGCGAEVSADYVMIGNDADFMRIPVLPATAQRIADHYGARLPTRKLVDKIMQRADVRLVARPLPTTRMRENRTYIESHEHIEEQLLATPEFRRGMLVAGHKKDLVVGPKVTSKNVVIYGFCKTLRAKKGDPLAFVGEENGKRWSYQWWQPEFGGHDNSWTDYSQNVRLVYRLFVDGAERPYDECMKDPTIAKFFADRPFSATRYPT